MKCKDVLIEKTEKGLTWDMSVKILRNHNANHVIGEAWIYEDEGRYYADLEPIDIDPTGLYPSIAFVTKSDDVNVPVGKIIALSLSDGVNSDPDIKAIGEGNSYVKGKAE